MPLFSNAFHPADQDHVVAGIDQFMHRAVEPGGDIGENRRAVRPLLPAHGGEAILDGAGEGVGDILLTLGENVDSEAFSSRSSSR